LPAKTFGQHLRKKRQKKEEEVGGWVGWVGWVVKTAQMHRAYKSTRSETLAPAQRAHVLHLLDGNLHALGSHQQQIAAGFSFLPTHSPQPRPLA